jgi:broad specificity phosphatase PhoE/ribonuclease HI
VSRSLVVEADGGSRGNPGPAGYGAVVKDAATGEVLAEAAEAIGVTTNNVAEYRGLLAGLRAAAAVEPGASVEVRMDSRLVVEQMSGRWRIKHDELRRLAREAAGVFPADRVRYAWVPRAQNAYADRLANEAMDAAAAGRPLPPTSSPADHAIRVDHANGGDGEPRAGTAPRASVPARDGGDPTTLLLVRHGRTADTLRGVFAGSGGADPPLSPEGEDDAARLAAVLRRLGTPASPLPGLPAVDAVVASPLLRAQGTAKAAAEQLGLDVVPDADWAEASFGAWDGLTYAESARRDAAALGAWYGDPSVAPPGGESFDDLAVRVRAARDRAVLAQPGRAVLVVTHGGPIRIVVRDALEAGAATLWRLRVTPAALTAVRFWPDGGVEVVTVNADVQLDG